MHPTTPPAPQRTRQFTVRYQLRDGKKGRLHLVTKTTCDAVVITMDAFGEQLQRCSASPA